MISKIWFSCLLFLAAFASTCFAQHKFADIPLIKISDFEGQPPSNSKFPIYTNSRVYYRIDTAIQVSEIKYKVIVKTKVELYHEGSFWDQKKVNSDVRERMLNHEQDHFYIAHIAANKLESELSSITYTSDYQEEVRNKFHELNRKLAEIDVKYDKETQHSRNLKAQEKWNIWVKKQLE